MYQDKIIDLEEKIFELESKLETKNQESRDLANIAAVITSILDTEAVLAVATEIAIRQVAGEVGALILLVDGQLSVKVAWGVEAEFIDRLKYKDNLDIARYTLRENRAFFDNDPSQSFGDHCSVRNFIAAPIVSKQTQGAMVIFNREDHSPFSEGDQNALEMICRFTSVAIENAQLLNDSLEKQKIEHELDLARQVQSTLLPEQVAVDGIDLAATYIPAGKVGGDYYDLIPVGNDGLLFLVGDVTSKGIPAALMMTSVHAIIHAYVMSMREIRVTEIMAQLNDILCDQVIKNRDMFITMFMAYIDLTGGTMEYCNGGHPPALYYRADGRATVRLQSGGPLVGQFAGMTYRSSKIRIFPADRIFVYTDGLTEAENRSGEIYGLDRLETFFKAGTVLDTARFNRVVKEEIDRFSSGAKPDTRDDFTSLVLDIQKPVSVREATFVYSSEIKNLQNLYADLEAFLAGHKIDDQTANALKVSVSEAFTNAIIHAHEGQVGKKIEINIRLNKSEITADILDEGSLKEIETLRSLGNDTDPDSEGGRGLGLIRRLSDEVIFSLRPEGGLKVTIIVKRK